MVAKSAETTPETSRCSYDGSLVRASHTSSSPLHTISGSDALHCTSGLTESRNRDLAFCEGPYRIDLFSAPIGRLCSVRRY